MFETWISTSWSDIFGVLISAVVTYAAIIGYCRLTGLRSFSKMSAADFAMTVAVGSLFASTIASPSPTLILGLFALLLLFLGQWVVASLRSATDSVTNLVDNEPLLLMNGPEILEENLLKANVTRDDLAAKLREANVIDYSEVKAVVFESTGDISVLHSSDSDKYVEADILRGVRGRDRVETIRT